MLTRCRRVLTRATRPGADEGYTLVELLVVIIIFGIIGTILASTVISSMSATRREQERVFTVQTAQTALERLSKDLRTADPLVAANLNDVTLLVYRSGHCERRQWWVDANNQLLMSRAVYSGASSSCSTKSGTLGTAEVQVVMDNAGVDDKTLIFRYWNKNTNAALTELTPPVASNQLTRIDRIELTIKGLLSENGTPVLLTSSVDLRNVEQLP